MGCETTRNEGVYVPRLDTNVEKPLLDAIPSLDGVSISNDDRKRLEMVFFAYNNNILKLVTYSRQLEEMNELIQDYYQDAMKATN